VSRKLL